MVLATQGNVVGFEHGFAGYINSNGFATGVTLPTDVSNADVLQPHPILEPRSIGLPNPQRVATQLTGGDKWLGAVMFGIASIDTFQLVTSAFDPVLTALATKSSVDVVLNARMRRVGMNINLGSPPQMFLILSTIFQGRRGVDGVNQWINYFIPRVQISPVMPQMSFQAANDQTYNCLATMTTKEITGLPFQQSSGGMNLAGNRDVMYVIISEYPLSITSFIGDGTTDTFKLGYLPATNVVTINDNTNDYVLSGTQVALSSVNLTTGVATLPVAPTAAAEASILYGMDESLTPSP